MSPPSSWKPFISTDVTIDETFSGQTITLSEGETLSIILASNATTGYAWNLDVHDLDSDILEKLDDTYYPSNTGYAGEGGYEQWIFRSEDSGTTAIKLDYAKIFDTHSITDTFEVDITVY